MKKILLSGLIVVAFISYAFYKKSSSTKTTEKITPSIVNSVEDDDRLRKPIVTSISKPTSSVSKYYKDGQYLGPVTDALYGDMQVNVVISGGKITDVQFLKYPGGKQTSIEINAQAMPILKSEVILAQSANVDIVSGATQTSNAFIESLTAALNKAV